MAAAERLVLPGGGKGGTLRLRQHRHHPASLPGLGRLDAAAVDYLESIAHDVVPDIDEHDATYQALRELHPEIDGSSVVVPDWLRADDTQP